MKIRTLAAACAVFLACSAYGQSVHQIAVPDSSGYPKVITESNPLPVTDSSVAIAAAPSNAVGTQTITLVANVAQKITSKLASGKSREFITISAMESGKDFWVQFNGVATISACQLAHDWASYPITEDVDVYVIASTAFDLFVLEGGK